MNEDAHLYMNVTYLYKSKVDMVGFLGVETRISGEIIYS